MTAQWCTDVVQEVVEKHGAPEIINTDQGAQFTSVEFKQLVLDNGIKLSMDGRGRATDNAFIERFWRSIKYEKLFLYILQNGSEAYMLIAEYMDYYNSERRYSSIDDCRPSELFNPELPTLQHSSKSLKEDFEALKVDNSQRLIIT